MHIIPIRAALRRAGYSLKDCIEEYNVMYQERIPPHRWSRALNGGHLVKYHEVVRVAIFISNRTELSYSDVIKQITNQSYKYEQPKTAED